MHVHPYTSPRSIGNLFSWGPVATDNYYYRETRYALGPLSNITVKQPMEYIKTLKKMDVPIIIGKERGVVFGVAHVHTHACAHTHALSLFLTCTLFLPLLSFLSHSLLSHTHPLSHWYTHAHLSHTIHIHSHTTLSHTILTPLIHPSHTLSHSHSSHQAQMSTKAMSSSSPPSHRECLKSSTKPAYLDSSTQVPQVF